MREFFGMGAAKKAAPAPKTTDRPNIDIFMIQLIRHYAPLVAIDKMDWQKAFKNKDDGKKYRVVITLEEIKE